MPTFTGPHTLTSDSEDTHTENQARSEGKRLSGFGGHQRLPALRMRPLAGARETELGSWGRRAYFSPKSYGGSGDTPQKQAGTAGLPVTTDAAAPATKANTRMVGEASCFPLICLRPGGNAGWGLLST